jgi:hypothetical protein
MGIWFGKTSSLFRIAPVALMVFVVSCGGGDSGSITGGAAQPPGNTVPPSGGGTAASTQQFGGQRFDGATCTAVDAAENIYIAGNTWGTVDAGAPNPDPTASTADIFIAKYNAAGILQWVKQLGSPLDDYATGIAVDNTGNVIVVGYTFGDLFGGNKDPQKLSSDYFILKLDPDGNQIWSLQDGTPTVDELWCVITDRNNDIYVGGGIRGDLSPFLNSGGGDSLVRRYSSAGALLWERVFTANAESSISARAMAIDEVRGSLYVEETLFHYRDVLIDNVVFTFPDYDILVEKLNPADGSTLWDFPFIYNLAATDNVPQWSFATGIAVDRDGYAYAVGYTVRRDKDATSNAGDVTFELFKLDSSGGLFWHSYYLAGPHPGNKAFGVVVDSMKDVYVTGYTSVALGADPALGGTDAFIMQFDSNTGATLWIRQFGTVGNDRAFGIALFDNRVGNNYYVVGETSGAMDGNPNIGGYDAFLVKYDQYGQRM